LRRKENAGANTKRFKRWQASEKLIAILHLNLEMGEVEIDAAGRYINIYSNIIIYGEAANAELARLMSEEIATMWNEPNTFIFYREQQFLVRFIISGECIPNIDQLQVISNTDPRNNYFRVEDFALGNISFVDGLGSNTGYFLAENLYAGSTTAAHEYGHTLGLDHPRRLDIRGLGVPGIMYPRGTLVDAEYQYDPFKPAGVTGGTMHPMKRKVKQDDIALLRIDKLKFVNRKAIIGGFTNIYHWKHERV
jgi:hypothetical protein